MTTNQEINSTKRGELSKVDPRVINVQENHNARQFFDPVAMAELKASIEENGVIDPIRCWRRKITQEDIDKGYIADQDGYTYFLINGERRLRCAKEVGIARMPVTIVDKRSYSEVTEVVEMLECNTGERLTQFELGIGYNKLLKHGLTVSEIAKRLGKKDSYVSTSISLLDEPKEIQNAMRDNLISPSAVLELRKQEKNPQKRIEIVLAAIANNQEVISDEVEETEADVKPKPTKTKKVTTKDLTKVEGGIETSSMKQFDKVWREIMEAKDVKPDNMFLADMIEFYSLVKVDGLSYSEALNTMAETKNKNVG